MFCLGLILQSSLLANTVPTFLFRITKEATATATAEHEEHFVLGSFHIMRLTNLPKGLQEIFFRARANGMKFFEEHTGAGQPFGKLRAILQDKGLMGRELSRGL